MRRKEGSHVARDALIDLKKPWNIVVWRIWASRVMFSRGEINSNVKKIISVKDWIEQ